MMYSRKTEGGKFMPQAEEGDVFVPLRTRSELIEALRSGLAAQQGQREPDILESVARLHDPAYQDDDTVLAARPDFRRPEEDDDASGMTSIITRKPLFRDEVAKDDEPQEADTVVRPRIVVNPYVQPAEKVGKAARKETAASSPAKPPKTPVAKTPTARTRKQKAPAEDKHVALDFTPSALSERVKGLFSRENASRVGHAGSEAVAWTKRHPYIAGAGAMVLAVALLSPQGRGAIAGIGEGIGNECDNATWCSASAQPQVPSSIEFPDLNDPKRRVGEVATYLIDPRPGSFKYQYNAADAAGNPDPASGVKSIGIRVGLAVPDSSKLETVGIQLSDEQQKNGKIDQYTNPNKVTPAQYVYFVSQYPEAYRPDLQEACQEDLNMIIEATQDKAGAIIADKDAAKALEDGESSITVAKEGKDDPKKANIFLYDVDPDAKSKEATRVLSCQ